MDSGLYLILQRIKDKWDWEGGKGLIFIFTISKVKRKIREEYSVASVERLTLNNAWENNWVCWEHELYIDEINIIIIH